METNASQKLFEKIKLVKRTVIIHYDPEYYNKEELIDKQKRINTLISYASVTGDSYLLEACQLIALEYVWQKGYAQEPKEYCLEQSQNTDDSITDLIKELRAEEVIQNE